jgi:hypothetical protein
VYCLRKRSKLRHAEICLRVAWYVTYVFEICHSQISYVRLSWQRVHLLLQKPWVQIQHLKKHKEKGKISIAAANSHAKKTSVLLTLEVQIAACRNLLASRLICHVCFEICHSHFSYQFY